MNNAASDWTSIPLQARLGESPVSDNQIDLREIFDLLKRKWLPILLTAALFALASIFYVQNATKYYGARATLILEAKEQNATGLESLVTGLSAEDTELNSQIEVIRSRKVVGQVVDVFGLQADPEFVAELNEPSVLGRAIQWIKKNTTSRLTMSPSAESTPGKTQPLRESAIDDLVKKLAISVIPKTHVFQIRLATSSPEKTSLLVNFLAEVFIADQVNARLESNSQAAIWLAEKVSELGNKLAVSEAEAAEYRSNTERNVSEADVAASNISLKNSRGRLSSFLNNLAASSQGSTLPRTDREQQRLELLQSDIQKLEAIVEKQTEDLLKLRQLDRDALASATIYQHFVKRLNEIEVQKGLQEADVRILSKAIPRYKPIKPRKIPIVFFGTFFGLLVGAGTVLGRRMLDRSFVDPAELQQAFGIPVIGTIPKSPGDGRRGLLSYAVKRPASALMEAIRDMRTSLMLSFGDEPRGAGRSTLTAANEHLETANAEIDYATEENARNGSVLLMTSSVSSEGKTTCSILLAINTAALDKKVLLIECDLRRSTFHSYFGRRADQLGLVDAISGTPNWENAIWTESNTKLDIVFGGGDKGTNAADIFASEKFASFIDLMRSHYDLIILDSPPVLPVPDARLIAKVSDAVIYVVRSSSTAKKTIAAGLRLFETIGVKVDGLCLTQMNKADGYGGNYYQN